MKPACLQRTWLVLSLVAFFSVLAQAAPAADLPADAVAKIEAALPAKSTAVPARPRKLLIFSLCKGFAHGSIPYAAYAIRRLGEKTGAYESVVSDDVAMFQPENLARFEAVCFNNTTGTLFEDPSLKKSLLDYVKNGGGIVGVHAATDCFYDWPEFGEMMGGYFDGHPWNEEVTVKVDDPGHPVVAAFGGKSFVVADEIYQFKDPYSRDKLRVLLSLDPTATDISKSGIKRSDYDFAVSWVRGYGKGRVFYCSLGHRNEIFWNPAILQHYLDGIQFAMGDIAADTTPSAKLALERGETMPLDDALAAAMKYEFGQSRLPLTVIADHVRDAMNNPSQRTAIVNHLLALLDSDRATDVCKGFACRQLALIGGAESVPALAALLPDPELSHMARYALERIPGDEASAALRDALSELEGNLRIGVINSIGRRGDAKAMPTMRQIAEQGDDETLLASVDAAGRIGGINAEALIFRVAVLALERRDERLRSAVFDALMSIAEGHMAEGKTAEARSIYQKLYDDQNNPTTIRVAALRGLAFADPVGSVNVVLDLLDDPDPLWNGTASRLIATMPGEQVTREFAGAIVESDDDAKIRLIEALARRGDPAARSAVTAAIGRSGKNVDVAAITALGFLGDASSVPMLAQIAAREGNPARASLDQLKGEDVDAAMAVAMENAEPPMRRELARSLGARKSVSQIPALLEHARFDRDRLVRGESLHSLGMLAGSEHIGEIVQALVETYSDDDREAAGNCIVEICNRVGDREACAKPVVAALSATDRASVKVSLLGVLGRIGGPTAFQAVRAAVADGGPAADAAVAALADWSDAEAVGDLLQIAQFSSDSRLREAAFRGFAKTAGLPSDRSAEDTVDMYGHALVVAANDDEIRLALAGLAKVPHLDAVKMAERYVSNPAVARDAAMAVLAAASAVSEEHPDEAAAAAEKILKSFKSDPELLAAAGKAVDHIQRNQDFIKIWKFAGPYTKEKLGGGELFDVAFAPEVGSDKDADWKSVPADAVVAPGVIDFTKMGGGNNCCGYLVTEITSPKAQDVRLETGSDDGLKVWLNGQIIHAKNAMRGLTVGEDVVNAKLKAGSNILLLKITQGGGDWRVCCRIRSADGLHLEDIEIRLPK